MKCLYYLAPTLESTRNVSEDLRAAGISDWYMHVVSKDEAGLKKEKVHSSNIIEQTDAFGGAFTGAVIGFIVGVLAAIVMMVAQLPISGFWYIIVVLGPTLFGVWEGMLLRAKYESKKIEPFHRDLEAGKYLFLIYTPKDKIDVVKRTMREKHPEAVHVAVDERFADPLSEPTQKLQEAREEETTKKASVR